MKSIALNQVSQFTKWDFQDLKFTELFRNEFINISMDVYDKGVKTPFINKKRPGGSNKIIIPFTGKLKITTEEESVIFEPAKEGLNLIIIGPEEKRSFENVGSVPVRVISFYAPPFQMKELDHLRGQFTNIPK